MPRSGMNDVNRVLMKHILQLSLINLMRGIPFELETLERLHNFLISIAPEPVIAVYMVAEAGLIEAQLMSAHLSCVYPNGHD